MNTHKMKPLANLTHSQLYDKVYGIFFEVIKDTSKKIEKDVRVRLNSQNRVDIDMVVNDNNNPYALIKVVEEDKKDSPIFALLKEEISQTAFAIQATWCIICSWEKIYYLGASDHTEIWKEKELDPTSIKEILFSRNAKNDCKVTEQNVNKVWTKILSTIELENKAAVEEFINGKSFVVKNESSYFYLEENIEDKLFKSILGPCNEDYLCRFTSLASLFRSCNEGEQSMCCLVCMNDKSEVDYAANKTFPTTIEDNNSCYIISCCSSEKENDFTMLRLYGDDAKGVCIRYKVDYSKIIEDKFILAPISYAKDNNQKHPELDFIRSIQAEEINGKKIRFKRWHIWQHFFKPFEYKDEKEIRLLFFDKCIEQPLEYYGKSNPPFTRKWIHESNYGIIAPIVTFKITNKNNVFPLVLNRITIGPKNQELEINAGQLNMLIKYKGIEFEDVNNEIVEKSKIEHYR